MLFFTLTNAVRDLERSNRQSRSSRIKIVEHSARVLLSEISWLKIILRTKQIAMILCAFLVALHQGLTLQGIFLAGVLVLVTEYLVCFAKTVERLQLIRVSQAETCMQEVRTTFKAQPMGQLQPAQSFTMMHIIMQVGRAIS